MAELRWRPSGRAGHKRSRSKRRLACLAGRALRRSLGASARAADPPRALPYRWHRAAENARRPAVQILRS